MAGVVAIVIQGKELKALKTGTLEEIHRTYKTQLTRKGPADKKFDNSYPKGVKVVEYTSDGLKLMAWLAQPEQLDKPGSKGKPAAKGKTAPKAKPKGELKRPAVVYLHGGTSLGAADFDEAARKFVDSGFVVLLPSMRGENGNPGNHEMCYGEVHDAAAAVDYVSKLPNVDKNLIFVAGHSIGGTNAMLLAEISTKLKKAAACGGFPDMYRAGAYPDPPFDEADNKERFYRSPAQYVTELKCPLLLLYGEKDPGDSRFAEQAEAMKNAGRESLKKITIETLPGKDHFTALDPAIDSMIEFFRSN